MPPLDWSYLQSFVAVAEQGSLSAAARAQNSSQPTLSRHIAQLEQSLGVRLFTRSKAGVRLTDKGTALMAQHRFTPSDVHHAQGEHNMMQQMPPGHSHGP